MKTKLKKLDKKTEVVSRVNNAAVLLVEIRKDLENLKKNKVDSSAYVLLQKRLADAEKEIREIKNLLLKEKKVAA
jgi:hypothetical protein